jgi:uncharacterized protein YvpB
MLKVMKYAISFVPFALFASACASDFPDMIERQKDKLIQETEELGTKLQLYLKKQATIEHVPFLQQLPELQRGCEVTSLAMLLQYGGVNVDKMTLAQEIAKVPFQTAGKHGNPNEGFVGNIYTFSQPGYGVYHKPIYELAQRYAPGKVIDLTGRDIEAVYKMISLGSPVWVITNATFQSLPDSKFETWQTGAGEAKITYHEHSVVIVGYDETYVYVNDPLETGPRTAHPRKQFEPAWVQMGKQAISLLPE